MANPAQHRKTVAQLRAEAEGFRKEAAIGDAANPATAASCRRLAERLDALAARREADARLATTIERQRQSRPTPTN
jgi:hypothetical protein